MDVDKDSGLVPVDSCASMFVFRPPDKSGYLKISFLISRSKHLCGYSIELSQ